MANNSSASVDNDLCYSCVACERPDSADNVMACDRCDSWWHYTCAGVSDSVQERDWTCPRCLPRAPSVGSNISRMSSASRRQMLQLELQHLAERRDFEKIQRELEAEKNFLQQKCKLLEATLDAENEDDARSVRSRISAIEARERANSVLSWISNTRTGGHDVNPGPAPTDAQNPPSIRILNFDEGAVGGAAEDTGRNTSVAADRIALQQLQEQLRLCQQSATPSPLQLRILKEKVRRCQAAIGKQTGAIPKTLPVPASTPQQNRERLLPRPTPAPEPTPAPLPRPAPQPAPAPQPVPPPQPAPGPRPAPQPQPAPGPWPVPAPPGPLPCPDPHPRPAPAPQPVPPPQPAPGPRPDPQPQPAPGPWPVLAPPVPLPCPDPHPRPAPGPWPVPAPPGPLPHPQPMPVPCPVPPPQPAPGPRPMSDHQLPLPAPVPAPYPYPYPDQPQPAPEHAAHAYPPFPAPNLAPAPGPHPVQVPPAFGPTPAQLAARQVMPRDLPEFTGDPEEWPMFLNSFNNSTEACGYSHVENLARLQRCLKGRALKAVRSHLLQPDLVPEVIRSLQTLYGRPEQIINKLIQNMRDCPPPKVERLETLIDYGMTVRNLTQYLIAAGQQAHLVNPCLVEEAVGKLPNAIKLQWSLHMYRYPNPTMQIFSEFMTTLVESASRVCQLGGIQSRSKDKGFVNAHIEEESVGETMANGGKSERKCNVCAKENHRVKDCEQFKEASVEDRWKIIHQLKLCRCCLNFHGRRNCRSFTRCGIDGCQYRHHSLLHTPQGSKNPQLNDDSLSHTYHHCGQSVLFRVLPVIIHGPSKSIATFALLDEGSTTTLVEQTLADELGVQGPNVPLCLKWTADMTRTENNSQLVTLRISGMRDNGQYRLDYARTVEKLNLSPQTLRFKELEECYPHLAGLPVDSYENAVPQLLIGLRNLRLAIPQRTREGTDGPCAVKTRLGWCVYGSLVKTNDIVNMNYHVCDCTSDERVDRMVRDYFNTEDLGTFPPQLIDSKEEARARSILQESTVYTGDRYQTGLLWRYDDIEFPESFPMALRRLECLERRMSRDPALKESVHRQVREYQDKGYAHPATEMELLGADPRRVWHLPLGVVTNPKKPGKTRLVWDAAAQVDGISLNSLLLSGPDLLTPLPHVLFRFRRYPVAVTSDIKEMFHQIRVAPADRNSQRFLFRNTPTDPPRVYLMDVATFGAACSPTIAQFIKNENARKYEVEYPRAVEGILKSHYVDDYLDSFVNVEEASNVAEQVQQIHARGGFQFHNWSSNSRTVLQNLGEITHTEAKDLLLSKGNLAERVLGMHWVPDEDTFSFSTSFSTEVQNLIETGCKPTKRQMLKCIMSIFDPLGLLASFLVHGKVLMQDVWRTGIKWDELVNEEIYERWRKWTELFERVNQIRVPRCYFDGADEDLYKNLQVHVFVDASETAYSAAVYFRVVLPDGTPQCVLVAAKTKVAPLKYHSIPRLELMAAVLGVRLCNFVLKGHNLEGAQRFFWSDSKTVLAWIRSDHRRYHQFVACRVGEILTSTNESQWRWVPSKLNVADEATKWGKGPCFDPFSRWFVGPNFLYLPEDKWPGLLSPAPTTEEEIRQCYLHRIVPLEPLINFSRFSSWNGLVRTTAYVKRFVTSCHRSKPERSRLLSHEELQEAQVTVWKLVQAECYPDEVTIMIRNKTLPPGKQTDIPKSSPLYKLSVFLDENGVLRIDGRIAAARIPAVDVKYPVILPKDHVATRLIVDDYHRKYLHGNSETVVNEIRQKYFIPKLRTLVRNVAQHCQHCIIYKAHPATPRMAPLPAARLSPYTRAFSYVGLDYFGPISVKVGRATAKRWVALFTCLTVRAVHMEIAHDLSTQSCIKCIRRFIARRGPPLEIYSDNGRNFCGAEKTLRDQLKGITTASATTFTNAHTKWCFTPPYTPHMGGSWERMVRSIKTAMMSLPKERKLDDEGLHTVVVEAEAIVNSRPLTYLPLDSEEQEALTPNHFLLLSSTGTNQPAVRLEDPVKTALKMQHLIQHNLDHFWRRWVVEYLPTLTRRTKWFKETKPIQPGDLVIVVDETCRNGWVRGRVKEVIPGKDGRIRNAIVQTAGGLFRRSVVNLAVLDVSGGSKVETGGPLYEEGNVATGTPRPCTDTPRPATLASELN